MKQGSRNITDKSFLVLPDIKTLFSAKS